MPVMIAHVAGVPIEEVLLPLLAGGTAAMTVVTGMSLRTAFRRGRRDEPEAECPTATTHER